MKKLSIIVLVIHFNFVSFAQIWEGQKIFYWDTVTFEEPYKFLRMDTSSQNIWQIGNPSKVLFDSAFLSYNAIITDSINPYPTNNTSSFEITICPENLLWYHSCTFIRFRHKYHTDSLCDGGYITCSYDGEHWMNIINDTIYPKHFDFHTPGSLESSENLYSESDTLCNGEFGFSGKSEGWITTTFGWFIIPVKEAGMEIWDSMLLRFNFVSDSIDNSKEGWMIDDIILFSVDLGGNIKDHSLDNDIKIYPNPTNSNISLELMKYYKDIFIEIYTVDGKKIFSQNYSSQSMIEISIDDFSPGIYKIVTMLDNKWYVTKLFIKK